jgi:hypothetical protein
MIIYARPAPPSSQATAKPITLQLCVARITPDLPPTNVRLPRPDDPTPRRPPLVFGSKRARTKLDAGAAFIAAQGKDKGKKTKMSAGAPGGEVRAKALPGKNKTGECSNVARLGSGVRVGVSEEVVFKVPMVPARKIAAGSGSMEKNSVSNVDTKAGGAIDEIEKANKTVRVLIFTHKPGLHVIPQLIKKTAVTQLSALGVSREHPEFTDLFGYAYRGTAFALVCTCTSTLCCYSSFCNCLSARKLRHREPDLIVL